MRITHIAHACMLLEANGIRLLTDPWIHGPTFFNTWWQFPPPRMSLEDIGPVDFVYLSHSHRDHQHAPTLDRIDKRTKVIIPKLSDPAQRKEIRALGFKNIIELGHKQNYRLGHGVELTLVRNDWDSAIIVHDGISTAFNANDCAYEHLIGFIKGLYGHVDIAFLPFLDARDFPAVYDLTDASFSGTQGQQDEEAAERFVRNALQLLPGAVVPFASHKVFVRAEQRFMNARLTPLELGERFRKAVRTRGCATEFFDMNSSDTWESGIGFTRRNLFDWTRYDDELERFYPTQADLLANAAAQERPPDDFEARFAEFAQRLVSRNLMIRKLFLNYKVAFEFTDRPTSYWCLDLDAGTVDGPCSAPPRDFHVMYRTRAFLFNLSMIEGREFWEDTMLSNLVFVKVGPNIPYMRIKFLKVFFNVRGSSRLFYRVVARRAYEQSRNRVLDAIVARRSS